MNKKDILFFTFLVIFILTSIITLLGVVKVIDIENYYLKGLFIAFIIELGGAVVGLYNKVDFFSKDHHGMLEEKENSHDVKPLPLSNTKKDITRKSTTTQKSAAKPGKMASVPLDIKRYLDEQKATMAGVDYDEEKLLQKYIGLDVEWEMKFESMKPSKVDDSLKDVFLYSDDLRSPSVYARNVDLDKFPFLKFIKNGDLTIVKGTILKIGYLASIIELETKGFVEVDVA